MDTQNALKRLALLRERRDHVEAEIDGLVALLRSPDLHGYCYATWREVGDALGVTRSAAQQLYRHLSWQGNPTADYVAEVEERIKAQRG